MSALMFVATFSTCLFTSVCSLQMQCYHCEESLLENDCSAPQFIVNCTANIQNACQKEVMVGTNDNCKLYKIPGKRALRRGCGGTVGLTGSCSLVGLGFESHLGCLVTDWHPILSVSPAPWVRLQLAATLLKTSGFSQCVSYRKACASFTTCLIVSAGYQSFCSPGHVGSVCISCCNTPLCNGPRPPRISRAHALHLSCLPVLQLTVYMVSRLAVLL
uniref:LY6/PLAUR domain containing 1 n=1 Tax=Scleropages formosus TaxID=113540 RepID=A0A8C9S3Q3_SCLFO